LLQNRDLDPSGVSPRFSLSPNMSPCHNAKARKM
jgi:hypothetical protein